MSGPVRLLVVEDDESRVRNFRLWLPPEVRLVWAKNAGQAMGTLRRAEADTFAGLMLDHDLDHRTMTADGSRFTGTHVAHVIVERLRQSAPPVLVHSMNFSEGDAMAATLERHGFPVTRIPMRELTRQSVLAWLDEVRDGME